MVPQNGWFIIQKPIKMDDLGGKPTIFGNIPQFSGAKREDSRTTWLNDQWLNDLQTTWNSHLIGMFRKFRSPILRVDGLAGSKWRVWQSLWGLRDLINLIFFVLEHVWSIKLGNHGSPYQRGHLLRHVIDSVLHWKLKAERHNNAFNRQNVQMFFSLENLQNPTFRSDKDVKTVGQDADL